MMRSICFAGVLASCAPRARCVACSTSSLWALRCIFFWPQLPDLERSANVLAETSEPLIVAALATEVAILLSYSDVLSRSVLTASRMRPSLEERRCSGLGPWFVFRLAITGLEAAGRADLDQEQRKAAQPTGARASL